MKKLKIKDTMWCKPIFLLIGNKEEVNVFLRKNNLDSDVKGFTGDGGFAESPDGTGYIWIQEYNQSIEMLGLLVHEVNHLVFHELEQRGFMLSMGSEEAYCYYAQNIFQEILATLYKEYEDKE